MFMDSLDSRELHVGSKLTHLHKTVLLCVHYCVLLTVLLWCAHVLMYIMLYVLFYR